MSIIVDPVVGYVSYDSIKFVLYTNKTKIYRIVCQDFETSIEVFGYHKYIIDGLQDNTEYIIKWYDHETNDLLYKYQIRTKQINPNYNDKIIAFVSCDNPTVDVKKSLWDEVSFLNPDICIHMGDNIYGDSIFNKSMRKKNKDYSKTIDYCRTAYLKKYMKTWNRWSYKLRNTSHWMIPDDHEVTDGYYYNKYEDDDDKKKRDISIQATHVMENLQMSLNKTNQPFIIDDIGKDILLCMYSRFYFNNNNMSDHIINLIEKAIEDHPCKHLVLVMAKPPVPTNDHWGIRVNNFIYGESKNEDEYIRLFYDKMFNWLHGDDERTLTVISGDVHLFMDMQISDDQGKSFHIYAASPISNQPTIGEKCTRKAYNREFNFYDYNIKGDCYARRNFVYLDTNTMKVTSVFSTYDRPTYFKMAYTGLSMLGY